MPCRGGLHRTDVWRLLICMVMVYLVVMFAAPWIAGLDLASHDAFGRLGQEVACGSRLMLYFNVLHLIAGKPWLGWGWGELDYAHFITLYNDPGFASFWITSITCRCM